MPLKIKILLANLYLKYKILVFKLHNLYTTYFETNYYMYKCYFCGKKGIYEQKKILKPEDILHICNKDSCQQKGNNFMVVPENPDLLIDGLPADDYLKQAARKYMSDVINNDGN